MALLSQILTWWSSNRVPSVAQRQATFNSFRHKDVAIDINDIANLTNILNSKANINDVKPNFIILPADTVSYLVPAGTLIKGFINCTGDGETFGVGLSDAGPDWIETTDLPAYGYIESARYFPEEQRIYFFGISSQLIIRIQLS